MDEQPEDMITCSNCELEREQLLSPFLELMVADNLEAHVHLCHVCIEELAEEIVNVKAWIAKGGDKQ